jgi:UDP-glucose 4-epimerase
VSLRDKKVLVTGGAGFIGSWIVDKISLHKPEKVIIVDNFSLGKVENLNKAKSLMNDNLQIFNCDITNYRALKNILKKEDRIDVVFNLAAKPLFISFVNPTNVFLTSVKIALNLSELQRNGLFKTLIHFSSSEAYGSAQYVPMDENHPLRPATPYGAGKAAADHIIMSYHESFGNDVTIIRPFNNFGPRQNEKTYAGIVPMTIRKILKGEPPVIFGDGNQTRDFIYVEDTAEAAIRIYKTEETRGKIINIGSGKEISINQLVHIIAKIMQYKGKIIYDKPRPADIKRNLADTTLAKKLIGFKPKFSLEEGLRRTIAWYVNKSSDQK